MRLKHPKSSIYFLNTYDSAGQIGLRSLNPPRVKVFDIAIRIRRKPPPCAGNSPNFLGPILLVFRVSWPNVFAEPVLVYPYFEGSYTRLGRVGPLETLRATPPNLFRDEHGQGQKLNRVWPLKTPGVILRRREGTYLSVEGIEFPHQLNQAYRRYEN